MGSINQDIKDTFLGLLETAEEKWSDFTQFLVETWPILIVLFLLLVGVWWYADPPPPRHVMLATGSAGGSYEELGKKYAEFFKKKGITLELVSTLGAQENIARLADRQDPIQAAFVQAGIINSSGIKGIESLGAIAYDPIWFFYRGNNDMQSDDFQNIHAQMIKFANARLSVGVPGSGTYAQAMHILEVSGLTKGPHIVNLPGAEAVKALQKGELDGIFIVDQFEAPNVQTLLNDPSLRLARFRRADAYAKLLPFLQILKVPVGGFSLIRNFPDQDIKLLATTTHLLIDDRMHPAIQFLFLEAAREINGKASFFANRGEFPAFKNSGLPESPVAVHLEKNGSPLLMQYFPFWLAELINRLIFVMLPFCALAYPVLLTLPGYRNKRMRRRIDILYGTLKTYEQELTEGSTPELKGEYLQKLDKLEYEALKLKVPKSMSGDYYALRTSIDYVRSCLNRGALPYQMGGENADEPLLL